MKNQTVKFTCSTDATLTVSMHGGKKDIHVMASERFTEGDRVKTKKGCHSYHEKTEAGEKAAIATFTKLVDDSIGAGWVKAATTERSGGFTSIPTPPGKSNGLSGGKAATPGKK
jgi:hypothetical protein